MARLKNNLYKSKENKNTFIIKNSKGIVELFLDKNGIIIRAIDVLVFKPYEYIEIGKTMFNEQCLAFYCKHKKLNDVIIKMLETLSQ